MVPKYYIIHGHKCKNQNVYALGFFLRQTLHLIMINNYNLQNVFFYMFYSSLKILRTTLFCYTIYMTSNAKKHFSLQQSTLHNDSDTKCSRQNTLKVMSKTTQYYIYAMVYCTYSFYQSIKRIIFIKDLEIERVVDCLPLMTYGLKLSLEA